MYVGVEPFYAKYDALSDKTLSKWVKITNPINKVGSYPFTITSADITPVTASSDAVEANTGEKTVSIVGVYTITFLSDSKNGQGENGTYATYTVKSNETIGSVATSLTNPTDKSGYTFRAWTKTVDGVTSDVNLFCRISGKKPGW